MKPIRSQEQIKAMRKRLYERGAVQEKVSQHALTDVKIAVDRNWHAAGGEDTVSEAESDTQTIPVTTVSEATTTASAEETASLSAGIVPPKKRYRRYVLGLSLVMFAVMAVVAIVFVYLGSGVSSDNIQITVTGKSLIGGGEVMPLEVAVSNENKVPIESATLILRYPNGTRSVEDTPRTLFEERIPLNNVEAGAMQQVPVQVAVFGEEHEEKQIEATIEFRISGSNGTFYKDATPFLFEISSTPVVLRIANVEKVASGQVATITLTVDSNSTTPLEELLITAAYPVGFNFQQSDPDPVYGDNVWQVASLAPGEETTITLTGLVTGLTEEAFRINFKAGPANPDNQYLVESTLTEAWADFVIEQPFIDVAVAINGDQDGAAILAEDEKSQVDIMMTNTLDETIYDMVVEVVPSGNALDIDSVESDSGFYDSNTGTIRWEVSNNKTFDRVLPGETRVARFSVRQGQEHTTASYNLMVNVYARRVAEPSAQETLVGSVQADARYSSVVTIGGQAGKTSADSGPVPPEVGKKSTYTLTLVAEAGANDLANAIVETSLPVYVTWLDSYETEESVVYDAVAKKLKWEIGSIAARDRKTMSLQVQIQPSVSQIRDIPVLLNRQTIRANDRFTNALLQDTAPAVTTELSPEMGYEKYNGEVVK